MPPPQRKDSHIEMYRAKMAQLKKDEANAGPKRGAGLMGFKSAGHELQNTVGTTQTGASLYELTNPEKYSYDYVMVFPIPNEKNGQTITSDDYAHKDCALTYQKMVSKLETAGLETFLFKSCQQDEMYIKIKAPLERLKEQADVNDHKMLLNPSELSRLLKEGFKFETGEVAPIEINPMPEYFPPTEYIHGKYDREDEILQPLYMKAHGCDHPFSSIHRIKLIKFIIEADESEGGCGVNLDQVVGEEADQGMLSHFPLHEAGYTKYIAEKFVVWCRFPGSEPLDLFRCYFGAKLALYMAFLVHLTRWLVFLSVPGLAVTVFVIEQDNADIYWAGVYAIFVAIWAFMFLESWKVRQATIAMKWGMSDFENEETERTEYAHFPGVVSTLSPINGKPIRWYPEERRKPAYRRSGFVTMVSMLVVMVFVSCVFYMKTLWGYWPDYASLINSVGIQILNAIYQFLAVKLTDNENLRTDTQYEDALINKLFLFQFLNSYISLYYIAFIELPYTGVQCAMGSCINDLCVTLAEVFIANICVANMTSIFLPKIMASMKFSAETDGIDPSTKLSPVELQYFMLQWNPSLDQLMAYNALALQYGYVVLFVAAFPAAPFLAMLSNYIQIRLDCKKFLFGYRRIEPIGAQDIGSWEGILTMINQAAVLTNTALVFFTMTVLDINPRLKIVGFAIVTYGLFGMMQIVQTLMPDVPEDVTIQLERQEFINTKVIDKVADEIEHTEPHLEKAPQPVDRDNCAHYDSINNFFKISGAEEDSSGHGDLRQIV